MINKCYAEIFNQALETFYFNCENNKDRATELKLLNNVAINVYGIAFCAEDTESMEAMKNAIEQLRRNILPRPFDLSRIGVVWT